MLPEAKAGRGVAAMVLAGDTIFTVGVEGGLLALSAKDGGVLASHDAPAPIWDGMAAAYGRLFLATAEGDVVCMGSAR